MVKVFSSEILLKLKIEFHHLGTVRLLSSKILKAINTSELLAVCGKLKSEYPTFSKTMEVRGFPFAKAFDIMAKLTL